MSTDTDRIEREVTIVATPERIWEVLTAPQHVGMWFGTGEAAQVDLRPGGEMVIDHGSHGRYRTVFVEVDPPRYLSYRWASGYPESRATEENSTLVEFTVTPVDGERTRLTVTESGFDSIVIPAERKDDAGYASHAQGWSGVIEKAAAYAEERDSSPLLSA